MNINLGTVLTSIASTVAAAAMIGVFMTLSDLSVGVAEIATKEETHWQSSLTTTEYLMNEAENHRDRLVDLERTSDVIQNTLNLRPVATTK